MYTHTFGSSIHGSQGDHHSPIQLDISHHYSTHFLYGCIILTWFVNYPFETNGNNCASKKNVVAVK